jgi:hypothetical protein
MADMALGLVYPELSGARRRFKMRFFPEGGVKSTMFRSSIRFAMLSLVLILAAQAQGQTLLSYWPMNDGLSNPTATTCTNYGTLGTAYNANFGVAYATGTSVLTPPGIALGTTSSGNLIGMPYAINGTTSNGYDGTYTANGGATYALPQWTTSGPAGFGYGLTFSGNNTVISGSAPSNNWGMNFVYVPAGGPTNAGQGGGGISGACGSTGANKNFAMSMWVNWNGTQIQATHAASGGTTMAPPVAGVVNYGQPICWNAASSFSDLEFGLTGPTPSSAHLSSTVNGTANTTLGGALNNWNNIVIAGSYNSSWTVYLNGQVAGNLPVGALSAMTSQQQMLTLGGDWAYSWPTAYNNSTGTGQLAGYVGGAAANSPWPNNGAGPSSGNSSSYIGPFNGSMSDVGFFGSATTALSAGEAESIYNTPQVAGLTTYNLGDMNELFGVFDAGATGSPVTIGSLTWQYSATLPGGYSPGQAWTDGTYYYVELANGTGVEALVPVVVTLHPGDANGDGRVDINDLTIVLAHYNQTGQDWANGEFTGDGTVDINDLTIVLANYGWSGTYGSPIKAVPEPGTLLFLLGAGVAGLLAYAWRRRR